MDVLDAVFLSGPPSDRATLRLSSGNNDFCSAPAERAFLKEGASRGEYPKKILRGFGACRSGAAVRLDDRLLDFFNRPLMCIIAAVDEAGCPAAGRGVGLHVLEDRESIEVIFSAWQWPRLEPSIRQTGRLAATFVNPSDYVSFQLKGSAVMRDTEAYHLDCADRFMTAATNVLESLGIARSTIAPWLTAREARVARLDVSEIYIQTPGSHAGMLAGARS